MQLRSKQDKTDECEFDRENNSDDTIRNKRVLIYVPSFLGMMDSLFVEGLGYLLFDCYNWKAKGYDFFLQIGKRMMIHNSRNIAVEWAIANDMDYILWLDDDMVIDKAKDLFTTLIKHDKDIVAPLFFQRRPPYLPLLFKRNIYANGIYTTFDNILDYPKNELVKVDGVGFGCALIKIEVFKKLQSPHFVMGNTFGEDLYFCNNAINAGFEIYCDTSIQVGHIGDVPISWECTYESHKKAAELFVKQKKEKDFENVAKITPKADIIMPCYKDYEMTRDAIESIINFSTGVDINLILINDGQKEPQLTKYLRKLNKLRDNVTLIENKPNVGWIKAINQGIEKAKSDYVMFINNDILIQPTMSQWLLKMCKYLEAHNDVGAVGPISNYVMGLQHMDNNRFILTLEHDTNFLIGFCMLVKKEVIDKIGGLDERFGMGGNDDLDYSIRIKEAGYRLKVLRDVFVNHIGTKSLPDICNGDVKKLDDDTRVILIDKWGKDKVDELFKITF